MCVWGGEGEGEGGVCVWCDGVGVGVIAWMGAVVIAWVKKGVCGLDSLDCCCKVHVHECVCVCV